uniref:F-box domain-containing protein n=1 Tax=Oryza meridionalis TaxID=40149 RepID=A0A0E0ED43_9ORYZ
MAIGQAKTKSSLSTSLSFSCSSTRILGRKRVAVSPAPPPSGGPHSPVRTLRKQRSTRLHMDDAVSLLESLPQDVLIKVLCKVNHSDLRPLLLVSKQTVVAREQHFAFATPSSKAALRGGEEEEQEAPGAPKLQRRVARSSPVWGKNLASISVNLFEAFESEVVEM